MSRSSDIDDTYKGHCGICGGSIKAAEACISLMQMKDGLKPFRCLDFSNSPNTEDVRLRFDELSGFPDNVASDSATVHNDCFDAVRPRRLDDRRLWIAAIRAAPWPHAPHLRLERDYIQLDLSLADGIGMRGLGKLPSELVALIHERSSESPLWRYNACLNTARSLRACAPEELSTSVSKVLKWERGTSPSLVYQTNERTKSRLTIDAFGLKRIEHFEEDTGYQTRPSTYKAFVILEPHEARSTKVHFKFYHARLELHATCRGFNIWDTPSRPSPVRYFLSPDPMQIHASTQLRTIPLDKITGLTFFVNYTDIYAIHAHTPSNPFAAAIYPLSSQSEDDTIIWIYVPIPKGDTVTAFGRRTVSDTRTVWLLMRLKLAGDVVFGFTGRYDDGLGPFKTEHSPATLIHDLRTSDPGPITILGVHGGSSQEAPVSPLKSPVPTMGDLEYMYLAYTSAPLQNIRRLRVFRSEEGSWRGMLLYYKNGAQRAVGQCRVGVDDSTSYDDPRGICLFGREALQHSESEWNDEFNARDVVIKTGDECEHGSPWLHRCRPLAGELGVWFAGAVARINVIV